MTKILEYINETRAELKHVSWPTKDQALAYTAVVVVISLIAAMYLGVFDFLFTFLLEQFV